MGITISWTKSWSSSDDGTILAGADLQNLQVNIQSAMTNVAANNAINTYSGSGIPYRTIVLTPGGATLPTTNPAGRANTDGTNLSYMTLDFDKDTDEKAYWIFRVPDSLTGTAANVNIAWTAAAGSVTNEVQFELSSGGVANDEALDAALGTAVELDDTLLATGDVHVTSTVSLTHGWVAGDLAIVKLIRDVDGPAGTDIAGDVKVLAVVIEYQAGSSTD